MAAILLGSLITASLASCSDDENNDTTAADEYDVDIADIHVVEQGDIDPREFLQNALQQASAGNGDEEKEEAYKALYQELLQQREAYEAHLIDSIDAVYGGNSTSAIKNQVFEGESCGYTVLNHPGTLADGTEGTLSTLIVYPKKIWISVDAKTIILGCHFTVTGDNEVPSKFKDLDYSSDAHVLTGEWVISGTNALLIMPDYEGYGATKDRSHPYLSREVQARQCMESVAAAVKWFTDDHKKKFKNGTKLVSIGYSQGGAVSAASYRYWLEHKSEQWLKNIPTFAGAVCGDGPYDPLATVMTYINTNRLYMPVAPALVLKALCDTDPDMIKAGCQYKDFCTEAFMNTKIFDWLATKRSTTDMCDNAIFAYADKHPDSLQYIKEGDRKVLPTDQAFNQATITYLKTGQLMRRAPEEKLRTLKNCLMKNSLLYNFTVPSDATFIFFHSVGDEVVPYSNLQAVLDAWGEHKVLAYRYDTGTKTHVATGRSFYLYYSDDYVLDIIRDNWDRGIKTITGKFY